MPIRVDIFLENMFDFIKNLIFKKTGTNVVQLNTGSVKVHYDYEKQIDRLKQYGMIINDYDFAKEFLKNHEYYRLSGYCHLFIQNDRFIKNITFEEIVDIYEFDRALRILILEYLYKIEIKFKSIISYYCADTYGPLAYLNYNNFNSKKFHKNFLATAKREIGRSDEKFIEHHIKNKNSIFPIWVVFEVLSFGTISKFYKNMKTKDKKSLSKIYFNGIDYEYIENWINVLSNFRNLCAHNSRLYNKKIFHTSIKYDNKFVCDNNSDIYDRIKILIIFLDNVDKNEFDNRMKVLCNNHIFAKNNLDYTYGN